MLGADENETKPVGKGGKRKSAQSGKKTERSRKTGQPKETPDQLQAQDGAQEAIVEATIAEAATTEEQIIHEQMAEESISTPPASAENSTRSHAAPETSVTTEVTPAVSVQALTNAYGDYSWKSLDQARTFFEQLAGVRSLDKAFQLQSDFAREAYDTFVAESRRIRELHGTLAKQRLGHLEEFVARMTRPTR
jgi:hypothetical protein